MIIPKCIRIQNATIPITCIRTAVKWRSQSVLSGVRQPNVKKGNWRKTEGWNPIARSLLEKKQPMLLFRSRSHTPRTAARIFIGSSCFVMAGHLFSIYLYAPEGFNELLRKFVGVSSFALAGCGLVAVFRNILAVNRIFAISSRDSGRNKQRSLMLRIETTRWPPWRNNVLDARPTDVRISQPVHIRQPPIYNASAQATTIKIGQETFTRLVENFFTNFWYAMQEIVFADGPYLTVAGNSVKFRLDEEPDYAWEGGSGLNNIVKHGLV